MKADKIKPQDFRLGNILNVRCVSDECKGLDDFTPWQINIYNLKDIVDENTDFEYKPIELTEEWLLKFGFNKSGEDDLYIHTNSYTNGLSYYDDTLHFCVEGESHPIYHIQYVHQLQNLYYSLTGSELTIKDNTKQ